MIASKSAIHKDNSPRAKALPGAPPDALATGETLFRAALHTMQDGFVLVDELGAVRLCNAAALEILKLREDELVGRAPMDPTEAIFTADGNPLPYDCHPIIRALRYSETVKDFVYGFFREDRRIAWLSVNTSPLTADGKTQPYAAVATFTDITQQMATAEKLERSEERFRVLFDRSTDAHILLDGCAIIDCNNAALRLMRCADAGELLSSTFLRFAPEHQADGQLSVDKFAMISATARESGFHRFEWLCVNAEAQEFTAEVTLTPMTMGNRPVLLAMLHDLTERKRADQQIKDYAIVLEYQNVQLETANAKLAALATTDSLTGLKNRHALEQGLGTEFMLARRFGTPLALVLLDVDSFKQFNDTFGHPAGDEVLKSVARLLRRNAREADIVARFGGEEFLVVLAETDLEGARQLAERIRADIEAGPWPLRPVTASFGVVELGQGMRSENDLISLADRALYQAKSDGRNRVATHTPPGAA